MKGPLVIAVILALAAFAQAVPAVVREGEVEGALLAPLNTAPLANIGCSLKTIAHGFSLMGEYSVKCFENSLVTGPLFWLFFPHCMASTFLDIVDLTVSTIRQQC